MHENTRKRKRRIKPNPPSISFDKRYKLDKYTKPWIALPYGGGRTYPTTRKYDSKSRTGVGGRKKGTQNKDKSEKNTPSIDIKKFFVTKQEPKNEPIIKQTPAEEINVPVRKKLKIDLETDSPVTQSGKLAYYRNTHRNSDRWSCAIDVMVEIFCSLFSNPILKECFITSHDQLISKLVDIARDRGEDLSKQPSLQLLDIFWENILAKYPDTGIPKGTVKAKVDDMMNHLACIFGEIGLKYSSKCSVCDKIFSDITSIQDEALWLLDGIPIQKANGNLAEAIKNTLHEKAGMNARRSRECSCGDIDGSTRRRKDKIMLCDDVEVHQTFSDILVLQFDVRQKGGKSCNDYKIPFKLPETLMLDDEAFQLYSAALHVPSHHMSIVRYGQEFFLLDDMAKDGLAKPYRSFSAAAAVRDKHISSVDAFVTEKLDFAINFAVYIRCDEQELKRSVLSPMEVKSTSSSQDENESIGTAATTTWKASLQTDDPEGPYSKTDSQSSSPIQSVDDTSTDGRSFKLGFWQGQYGWMYMNVSEGGFKCKDCEIFGVPGRGRGAEKWITKPVVSLGTHAKRSLRAHENSDKHQSAVRKKTQARQTFLIDKFVAKKISKEESLKIKQTAIVQLVKIVVFMIKKKWALMTNFQDFVEFVAQELEGQVLKSFLSDSAGNAQYTSHYSVQEFIDSISKWVHRQTLNLVTSSSMYSVILDEATDEANHENMALFIRMMKDGQIIVVFLGLLRIVDKSARGLFNAIETYFRSINLDLKSCVFAGMDTTNVMSGIRGGLQVFFKEAHPHCIYVKCRNHLLALPFKHLEKEHKIIQRFVSFMLHLWKTYEDSTLRSDDLENTFKVHGYEPRRMIKALVTRWLSIGPACARHSYYYEVHVDAFDQILSRKFDSTVKGIRDELCSLDMVFITGLLADVTMLTNKIQTILQEKTLVFGKITSLRDELLAAIQNINDNPCLEDCHCNKKNEKQILRRLDGNHEVLTGCHLSRVRKRLEIAKTRSELVRRSRSQAANTAGQTEIAHFMESLGKPILVNLKRELEHALHIDDQLTGLCYLDPENLPDSEEALDIEALNSTVEFYGRLQTRGQNMSFPKLSEVDAKAEIIPMLTLVIKWKSEALKNIQQQKQECEDRLENLEKKKQHMVTASKAKTPAKVKSIQKIEKDIKSAQKKASNLNQTSFGLKELIMKWETSDSKLKFKQCNTLLKLAALVPGSVAEVERAWSVMNLISTPLRSTLTSTNLEKLMRISLHSGQFAWKEIVETWKESPRRIGKDIGED